MRLPLLLSVSLLLASPAFAADEPAATTPTAAEPAAPAAPATGAKSDKDIKVCRMVKEIGSNRATRVCRTKAQIDADSDIARNQLNGPQGDKSL